jgi:ABC-type multidrug transport system permease subunit
MSFAWNCLFKKKESSFSSFSAVVTFGSFLSGAFVPLSMFPEGIVQYIGAILPAYWAVRGITSVYEYGLTWDYLLSIGAMLLFTAAFLLYGGKRRMI